MASVVLPVAVPKTCSVEVLDLAEIARKKAKRPLKNSDENTISITQYHPDLRSVISENPSFSLLLSTLESSKNPFFHAACVYQPAHNELYITSDLLQPVQTGQLPIVLISKIQLKRDEITGHIGSLTWQKLRPPSNMPMPAGAVRYGHDGIVFCSQGTTTAGTGGLYHMQRGMPPVPVVTNYFGRDFNSVHDVIEGGDGSLWFTDPHHGFLNDFRPKPELPCHIYRYAPNSGSLRVMAEDVGQAHSIALSPQKRILYVTNTGPDLAGGESVVKRTGAIYAFDVVGEVGEPFLANKRLFAYSVAGNPKGIRCDKKGNVLVACDDGVETWSPSGMILGVIEVPGGVTSLSFGREYELFLCSEQRLWTVQSGDLPTRTGPNNR
ncbi:smp-30/gluconolaconase/lre-like region-containing protein [Bombardia bombarda]|uniref:Smp-30/gluconolaconase/lre-like region-containing protein n=1 Tax=Bombardia bombarda TaxID=252184 RepID=A0AA39XPB6_9PEZI|nr:smp-30/gluconolaconase/lre-like region-containing protein [Bombardia bombarda]